MKLTVKKKQKPTKEKEASKSPTQTAKVLLKLEAATLKLNQWKEDNQELMDELTTLQEEVEVAENEVKTYAKEHRTNLLGETLQATFQPVSRRWWDVKSLKAAVKDWDRLGLIRKEEVVDVEQLEKLFENERLDRKVITKAAQQSEETHTRCTIAPKGTVNLYAQQAVHRPK